MSFSGFTLVLVGCGRFGLVIESVLFVELQGLYGLHFGQLIP